MDLLADKEEYTEKDLKGLLERALAGESGASTKLVDLMNKGVVNSIGSLKAALKKQDVDVVDNDDDDSESSVCCIRALMTEMEVKASAEEKETVACFGFPVTKTVDNESWENYRTKAAGISSDIAKRIGIKPLAVVPEKLWDMILKTSGLYRFETIDANGAVLYDHDRIYANLRDSVFRRSANPTPESVKIAFESISRRVAGGMLSYIWPERIDKEYSSRRRVTIIFKDFEGAAEMSDICMKMKADSIAPFVAIEESLITVDSSEIVANTVGDLISDWRAEEKRRADEARRREEASTQNVKDPIVYTKYDGMIVVMKQIGNFPKEKELLRVVSRLTKRDIMNNL